jgi:hypothetical protein
MYRQITAGNLDDLKRKIENQQDCTIFIKLPLYKQISKLDIETNNQLMIELRERKIKLILEHPDNRLYNVDLKTIKGGK